LREGEEVLFVKQLGSAVGEKPKTRGALRALGLGHVGQTNFQPNTPSTLGSLARVRHLVVAAPIAYGTPEGSATVDQLDSGGGAPSPETLRWVTLQTSVTLHGINLPPATRSPSSDLGEEDGMKPLAESPKPYSMGSEGDLSGWLFEPNPHKDEWVKVEPGVDCVAIHWSTTISDPHTALSLLRGLVDSDNRWHVRAETQDSDTPPVDGPLTASRLKQVKSGTNFLLLFSDSTAYQWRQESGGWQLGWLGDPSEAKTACDLLESTGTDGVRHLSREVEDLVRKDLSHT